MARLLKVRAQDKSWESDSGDLGKDFRRVGFLYSTAPFMLCLHRYLNISNLYKSNLFIKLHNDKIVVCLVGENLEVVYVSFHDQPSRRIAVRLDACCFKVEFPKLSLVGRPAGSVYILLVCSSSSFHQQVERCFNPGIFQNSPRAAP